MFAVRWSPVGQIVNSGAASGTYWTNLQDEERA
jgi:hypothetical protein